MPYLLFAYRISIPQFRYDIPSNFPSNFSQADLYPDTRSTKPALTAEQFIEGKNAPPVLMAVNPEAAKAGPKVQVAKKANILAQMPP